MTTLYNEIDPFAARWLRALSDRGAVAQGVVDERPIETLRAAEVWGAGQRHFFAGIGGWSLALRAAGLPDDFDVWTGSCPCQPFSSASRGRGGGVASPKHLWPAWRTLISECRPAVVLGEQVATGAGPHWLDGVADDFEHLGYAFAAADLCSSLYGFPPRRRLYFVAYTYGQSERLRALDAEVARIRPAAGLADEARDALLEVDADSDGFPDRMGVRRCYGNAINPLVAAAFIRAALAS